MKLAAFIALSLAAASSQALELVHNGSFETPTPDASWLTHPDGPYYQASFDSWTVSGAAGVWRPFLSANTFANIPDGLQAGYTGNGISGGTLTQDLHHVAAAGEVATLSVDFGDRVDLAPTIHSIGSAGLVANGSDVATIYFFGSYSGTWSHFVLPADLTRYAGQNLSVVLAGDAGTQMSYDKVSVNITPEPASLAILALGLGALARRRAK